MGVIHDAYGSRKKEEVMRETFPFLFEEKTHSFLAIASLSRISALSKADMVDWLKGKNHIDLINSHKLDTPLEKQLAKTAIFLNKGKWHEDDLRYIDRAFLGNERHIVYWLNEPVLDYDPDRIPSMDKIRKELKREMNLRFELQEQRELLDSLVADFLWKQAEWSDVEGAPELLSSQYNLSGILQNDFLIEVEYSHTIEIPFVGEIPICTRFALSGDIDDEPDKWYGAIEVTVIEEFGKPLIVSEKSAKFKSNAWHIGE